MQKEQKARYIILGMLISVVLSYTVIPVLAETGQKNIAVTYNNIKLVLDGVQKTPTDANGNVVEPFTYNGTTFVPLRFVAEAFSKDVSWDGATATATIGAKQLKYLDELSTYEYTSLLGNGRSYNKSIGQGEANKYKFQRAVQFRQRAYKVDVDSAEITKTTYLLNREYSRFMATIFAAKYDGYEKGHPSIIKIYGDGRLLYTSQGYSTDTISTDIDLDVKGISLLLIEITTQRNPVNDDTVERDIYFGDARLTR